VLALAVPLGLLIGLSLGALGGGGSILTVPALVYVLGQSPVAATTGSLIIVGVTSLTGMVAHARAGRVRVAQGLLFGVLGVAGSWYGSRLSASLAPAVLLAAFSVLMLVVAAIMIARQRLGRRGAALQDDAFDPIIAFTPRSVCDCPRAAKVVVTATAVGLLTGFFGVGGGFAVVPALVLALGFSMPVAVGTSLLVIANNSATALGSRAGHGISIDWALIAVFTAAAVIGSLLGGRIASRVRPEALSRAFTVLLVAVALYTAARSIPQFP
jgi:uncharacterized membrane protein YfcA